MNDVEYKIGALDSNHKVIEVTSSSTSSKYGIDITVGGSSTLTVTKGDKIPDTTTEDKTDTFRLLC